MRKRMRKTLTLLLVMGLLSPALTGLSASARETHMPHFIGADVITWGELSGRSWEENGGNLYPDIHDGVYLLSNKDFIRMDTNQVVTLPEGLYFPNMSYTTMMIEPRPVFGNGLGRVFSAETELYGFVDKTGKLVIPCTYSMAYPFSEGLAMVENSEWQVGYIDTTGRQVIGYQYSMGYSFSDGLAAVYNSQLKTHYIDKSGKAVIMVDYNMIYPFYDGMGGFIGATDPKYPHHILYSALDKTGKQPFAVTSQVPIIFSEGLAAVTPVEGPSGYIDKQGNLVIPWEVGSPNAQNRFHEGRAYLHYCYIDTTGRVIAQSEGALSQKYGYLQLGDGRPFSDGLCALSFGRLDGYMNKEGKMVICPAAPLEEGFFANCSGFSGGKAVSYKWNTETGHVVWEIIANPLYVDYSKISAAPTASLVLIDGKEVSFDAYNIRDNNYFKLRDVAYALNGTKAQFDTFWDPALNVVGVLPGDSYTPVGGEMEGKGQEAKTPVPTTSHFAVGKERGAALSFNIGGNNYFKLRDLGQILNFDVSWDQGANTIAIDTKKPYTPD